jgi:hypothetical protein
MFVNAVDAIPRLADIVMGSNINYCSPIGTLLSVFASSLFMDSINRFVK